MLNSCTRERFFGVAFLILSLGKCGESTISEDEESAAASSAGHLSREKRSLFQFGDMIRFTTKQDPLIYNHYGNHCGWISGNRPITDGVDRCCYHHDRCYQRARAGVCSYLRVVSSMVHYDFSLIKNTIACQDRGRICQRTVCECDKRTAYCFASHRYNPRLKRPHFTDILIRRGRG